MFLQYHLKDISFYRKSIILLVFCLLSISIFPQQDNLIEKASELVYSNPNETIKIAELILKTSPNIQEKSVAKLLLAKSHLVNGDYNKAIVSAFDENILLDEIDTHIRVENYIVKATLLRKLYLDKQSEQCFNKALEELSSWSGRNKDNLEHKIIFERINMLLDRRQSVEALAEINKTEKQLRNFYAENVERKHTLYLAKEKAFSNLAQHDSAFVYINKVFTGIDSSQTNNLYEKAVMYKELGYLHLQNKAFKKSEEYLFIALRISEILGNTNLLMEINREIAINYLASNQKSQHKVYNDEFLQLKNEVDIMEQESVNMAYNLITNQNENKVLSEKSILKRHQNILLIIVLFVVIVCVFFVLKSQARKKRLNEIIKYLQISRNNFITVKPSKKHSRKRIVIPEETEKNILQKLKRFEASTKYLNKDMSLAVLAGQFETNTKYLSGIINKHYNDNFNTFINKLRIKYIINKLKSDSNYINYKISFLAEESGYSSHSSFATVFKSIIGMSPATFINLIREEREEEKSTNVT